MWSPLRGLNLNRRYISGFEPEVLLTVDDDDDYDDAKVRNLAALKMQMLTTCHIRPLTHTFDLVIMG